MFRIFAVAVVGAIIGCATTAAAATSWHVFATGTDSGDYGAFATASADVLKAHALAVRASKPAKLSWSLYCSSADRALPAGRVFAVTIANAKDCHLSATASTETSGTVKVQLLRR